MPINIIKNHQLSSVPWGNGAGYMSEIFRYPAAHSNVDYLVRFSTASIEVPVSEFTLYPGYIRHHRTLEGLCAFHIEHANGTQLTDHSGTVFDFHGETPLRCERITDYAFAINLIHKPQVQVSDRVMQVTSSAMPLAALVNHPSQPVGAEQKVINIVHIIQGTLSLTKAENNSHNTLAQGDTLILTGNDGVTATHSCNITGADAKLYLVCVVLAT